MRMCTSVAPALRSISTTLGVVVPRTIESSTTTSRLPAVTCLRGLNFRYTPWSRRRWSGWVEGGPAGGVGQADHEVGFNRLLARQLPAHGPPRGVEQLLPQDGVRTREVD